MAKALWFTGLSGSGKTTIANELKNKLELEGKTVKIFDGDVVRETLNRDLGFSREDIKENNRLIAELVKKEKENYDFILIPIISPYREDRSMARSIVGEDFLELFINAPLEQCIQRDVKGLYKKALNGEITNFIGVADSNPYQQPLNSDLEIKTNLIGLNESVNKIMRFIKMEKMELSPETTLAVEAALKAGEAILKIYNTDFSVSHKAGEEPVTIADTTSNEIIIELLSNGSYPILSEESLDSKERLNHAKVWIIDPLDGTSDFINKSEQFSVMIALVENGVPINGVVYQPITKKQFVAQKGKGAYLKENGIWTKLTASKALDLKSCRAVLSRHHLSDKERNILNNLEISKFSQMGSCGLKVADLCEGNSELYFTTTDKIKQWDTAAAYCLITEAGGMITDMLGNELVYNTEVVNHAQGILVSNGQFHDNVVNKFKEAVDNNYN